MPNDFVATFKRQSKLAERISSIESSEEPVSTVDRVAGAPKASPKKEAMRQINFRVPDSVAQEWGNAMYFLDEQASPILEGFLRRWLEENRARVEAAIEDRGFRRAR